MATLAKKDKAVSPADWVRDRIKPEQIEKYLDHGRCFVDEAAIDRALAVNRRPRPAGSGTSCRNRWPSRP